MQLRTNHLIYLFFTFFLLLITRAAFAAEPAVHISPAPAWINVLKPYDKNIPLRTVQNGYFYQLFEEQVQVEKQADYTRVIRQIVSDEGIQDGSEISISFDPLYERLDCHQLIVWRDGKAQNRLNPGAFKIVADEKDLSRFIYQGTYSAVFILPDIRKGDKIEYSYTITGRNPIFGNKYFRDLYLQLGLPVAHIYKALLVSPGRNLSIKSFNKPPKPVVSVKDGLKCYEWEDFQVKAAEDYDNEPGWYNNYNYVQVSDYSSWKEVVDWGLSINPLSINIKGELAQQVAQMKAASHGDKATYFRSAVKLVQNEVRYMGIEMGQYSHKANDPEKVFNQRYGDCKDKSLLLASILHADGIEANMVLINSGVKGGIDQFLPSPNDFDHAVVVANVNNKQVWVDATISYEGGTGTKLYFPNYGKGLILKAGNNALTGIPLTQSGKVNCKELYTIHKADSVTLAVTTTYTLDEADDERQRMASSGMDETEGNYLKYYQKIYPKIEREDSVIVKDDVDKNVITTIEHYNIPKFFKPDSTNDKDQASFYADFVAEQITHVPNSVEGPVTLNYPYDLDYTTIVVLPVNWDHSDTKADVSNDEFKFHADYTANADTLYLHYTLSYLKDVVAANRLDDYRKAVKDVEDNDLSYSFSYIPDITKVPVNINFTMVALLLLITVVIAFAGVLTYRTETETVMFAPGKTFVPLGGWLILVALGLAGTVIITLVRLFTNGYFNLHTWNSLPTAISVTGYRVMFVTRAAGNTIMMCFACFCLVLMLSKRNILPRMMVIFYIYCMVYTGIYLFLVSGVYHIQDEGTATVFIRAIVAGAIWIPYFRMSVRVRDTFVVPYPANNYFYEQFLPKEEKPAEDDIPPETDMN